MSEAKAAEMRMETLNAQGAAESTGVDDLYDEDLRGFTDQSRKGVLMRYFSSEEKPAPPTMGNYRRMFVAFTVLALITFPLNVVLQEESGSYECSTDDVVRARVGSDVLGAMAVSIFKEMAVVFYFRAWLEVELPQAAIKVGVSSLDQATGNVDAASLSQELYDVSRLVEWYLQSKANRDRIRLSCFRSKSIVFAAHEVYDTMCRAKGVQSFNHSYHPDDRTLAVFVNRTSNNFVYDAVVQFLKTDAEAFVQTNLNATFRNQQWCSDANSIARDFDRIDNICVALDGIEKVSDTLGKSIAVKCLPRVHFEGVRWFAIFSLKTMFSIFLSGAIISFADVWSSARGSTSRRRSTVMF